MLNKMNQSISLGSGLEMVVVDSIDFDKDGALMELVKEGVELQRDVFDKQNVSFPEDRVLLYEDSVGTRNNPGSLCEGKPYHHLYLKRDGKLIGMRVTQEFYDVELWLPKIRNTVAIDYFPSLVLPEAQERKYHVFVPLLGEKPIDSFAPGEINVPVPLTPVEVLTRFSRHLKYPEESLDARFNDGLCLSKDMLRKMQYSACEIKVPVPSMAASTLKEYNTIIDEMTIFGKFINGMPALLNKDGAERILIQEYLTAGYVNSDEEGHILDSRGRQLKATVDGLECVKLLRQRISEAVADHGSVLFQQI